MDSGIVGDGDNLSGVIDGRGECLISDIAERGDNPAPDNGANLGITIGGKELALKI